MGDDGIVFSLAVVVIVAVVVVIVDGGDNGDELAIELVVFVVDIGCLISSAVRLLNVAVVVVDVSVGPHLTKKKLIYLLNKKLNFKG